MKQDTIRRRQLLIGGIAAASLAGCIGDDDDDDTDDDATDDTADTDDDPVDDTDDTADDDDTMDDDADDEPSDTEIAAEHIEDARSHIQSAFDELAKRDDDEFEPEPFQGYLGDATQELDEAAALADGDQTEEIDSLEAVIEYLTPIGEAEASIDTGFARLETGTDAYWDARGYYEPGTDQEPDGFADALDEFTTSAEAFEEAHEQFESAALDFETARELLEDIDEATINEFDTDSHDTQYDEHDWAQYFSANMNFLSIGLSRATWAWQQTSHGLYYAFSDEWDDATPHLEEAHDLFEESAGDHMFVDFVFLYDNLPFLEEWFEIQLCENEHGTEMIDHFKTSVEHGADGDDDAATAEADEGFAVPDGCHDG